MDIGYRQAREAPSGDLRLVSTASEVLELREFDLFHAAWRLWFGRVPSDRVLEPIFVDYLFNQQVPHWVRHFARRVISDTEANALDPRSLGASDYPRRDPLPDLGDSYLMMGYVAALGLLLMMSA